MNSLRPTQKDVATKAGVAQATVSQALSNHPRIPLATRKRIQGIAAELGYRPDPYLSRLASYRKRLRPENFHGKLAWVSNYPRENSWRQSKVFLNYFEGAERRALQLGYQLEEFCLRDFGANTKRLERILTARGIEGLLLAPQPHPDTVLEFNFDPFSVVTLGYTLVKPQLHTVAQHHYKSVEMMVQKLSQLGYKRPGMVIAEEQDRRSDRMWSATFLSEERLLLAASRMPLLSLKEYDKARFINWFRRYSPDVIVGISPKIMHWLREIEIEIPEQVGFASLAVSESDGALSGVSENPLLLGAKAAEFLVDLLHRDERGVPEFPTFMLVAGWWIEGKTLRPQRPERNTPDSLAALAGSPSRAPGSK